MLSYSLRDSCGARLGPLRSWPGRSSWTGALRERPEVELAATVDAQGVATLVWSRELASDDFDEHVEAGDAVARTRLRAGSAPLAVGAASGVASRRPGTVRVVVHATAPGGDRTTVRSVRIHVARRPALPVERPVRVRARRRGDAIVVRWRTAAPARRQYFIVAAGDTRTLTFVSGRGRTRFRARLRPPEGAAVRRVLVVAFGADSSAERGVRVPVR